MDTDSTEKTESELVSTKKKYERPELVNHGTVADLTQSGGNAHRDGVFSRKLS